MKVLIFGGSGFVGQHLAKYLGAKGFEVLIATRGKRNVKYGKRVAYQVEEIENLFISLGNEYTVINLAGESLNSGRWTAKRKQEILKSRIKITEAIATAIAKVPNKPYVVVNASAVGYYGYSDESTFTEESAPGSGFLADVVKVWEETILNAKEETRVVSLRLGVVLGTDGGALPRMLLPYLLYMGGRVGSGKQWLSWIHIDDVVGIVDQCIRDQNIRGAVNVTAPHPVTMDQFGRTIGKVLGRPHWLPVPAFALKILLGQMSEIVLQGQKVLPRKALDHAYTFKYPELDQALADLLN